ncbi:YpoC family protein [Sporosarcina sp. CAU 1771]
MSLFAKENIQPFYEKWESVKDRIKLYYDEKDPRAFDLMNEAIENYTELLTYGGKQIDSRTEKLVDALMPLNGEERFQFVKDRVHSHYSFVQLDALYEESKKKAARLNITMKKES